MNNKTHFFAGVVLATLVLLGGCQTLPNETKSAATTNEADTLYDGEARVLYDAKQKAKTSRQAMEFAEQALQVGDTDRARYQFVTAYELDSSQYLALYKVGMIHAREGKLERAALALKLALRTKPDHTESLIELGLVEMRMRRYEQARQHIERAVEGNPESWRAFNGLAVLADLEKDFQLAEGYYQKALQLNPVSPVVWNYRGYSRYLSGDWDRAQEYIEKALDLDSSYRKAWVNYGLIQVRRGAYDDALSAFDRVMEKANAYERVGSLAMIEGKYGTAEYFLNRAIDTSPTYYEAAYDKANRLKKLRGAGDEYSLAQALRADRNRDVGDRRSDLEPMPDRAATIRADEDKETTQVHHTMSN